MIKTTKLSYNRWAVYQGEEKVGELVSANKRPWVEKANLGRGAGVNLRNVLNFVLPKTS